MLYNLLLEATTLHLCIGKAYLKEWLRDKSRRNVAVSERYKPLVYRSWTRANTVSGNYTSGPVKMQSQLIVGKQSTW